MRISGQYVCQDTWELVLSSFTLVTQRNSVKGTFKQTNLILQCCHGTPQPWAKMAQPTRLGLPAARWPDHTSNPGHELSTVRLSAGLPDDELKSVGKEKKHYILFKRVSTVLVPQTLSLVSLSVCVSPP